MLYKIGLFIYSLISAAVTALCAYTLFTTQFAKDDARAAIPVIFMLIGFICFVIFTINLFDGNK